MVIWSYVGGLIVLAVSAQVGLIALETIRRARDRQRQSAIELQLLETQLGIMRDLRQKRAEYPLPWGGYRNFQVARKVIECGDICSFYLDSVLCSGNKHWSGFAGEKRRA